MVVVRDGVPATMEGFVLLKFGRASAGDDINF